MAWVDQCGLRSDAAPPGRSWAPIGTHAGGAGEAGNGWGVNVMSAVASRGALWFTVFTGQFTAPVFAAFLDRLARQAGRKVHVIADGHSVHRGRAVRAWPRANADRIELHLMPGYSPELNPDESINARIRRAVNARGHFPTEQAALKCVYLAIMSLDPTGTGRKRWSNRWKKALNAFEITFDGRLSAGRK
ncbi:transposase [Kibdelosporangium philippinense]|uniref:transposase n=1 Tax=Kibdelosporangium philippinense TaxID=211113 RepID=UPI0035563701